MANSTFPAIDFSENPTCYLETTFMVETYSSDCPNSGLIDMMGTDGLVESYHSSINSIACPSQNPNSFHDHASKTIEEPRTQEGGDKKSKKDVRERISFRTKSSLEVMDDGFKWKKYGKKAVKNNPNPRNYYKCSSGGCIVKKRVERDKEDPSYVITTYEGVHNHKSPSVADNVDETTNCRVSTLQPLYFMKPNPS